MMTTLREVVPSHSIVRVSAHFALLEMQRFSIQRPSAGFLEPPKTQKEVSIIGVAVFGG